MINYDDKICIIGLGYVGLPLAIEFGKYFDVIGFDINKTRVSQLTNSIDVTKEVEPQELQSSQRIKFTDNIDDLTDCRVYIVTVPTPITETFEPDLSPITSATDLVANVIQRDDFVIYESTVYPGLTEEYCAPLIEKVTGLVANIDFHIGYSPERINPGDYKNRLPNIIKITSGGTKYSAQAIDKLYSKIITAGTYPAESIKVAEAAKVIENVQRDVNIGLINELSNIFSLLSIDTHQVLNAASSKWNFLKFVPGLVGGHCIGVDPYYLTYKANSLGYYPEMILSGRRINEGVADKVVTQLLEALVSSKKDTSAGKILILGVTFKENCPDVRNSKVIDVFRKLKQLKINVDIYDPHADYSAIPPDVSINMINELNPSNYIGIIVAVGHKEFINMSKDDLIKLSTENAIVFDVKSIYPIEYSDLRL